MIPIDIHTHSIASGHGTTETISDMAKAAAGKGMTLLGISDHGPATPASCKDPYFRGLKLAPGTRSGIRLLYGIEANILDESGQLDVTDDILQGLDYVIASIHAPSFRPLPAAHTHFPSGTAAGHIKTSGANIFPTNASEEISCNTNAYINAMKNPYVKIIGHPDDAHFPIDAEAFVKAAAQYHIILEVNEASLAPGGYRGDTRETMLRLLRLSREYRIPVLLSSDSHGSHNIGEAPCAMALAQEAGYSREELLNFQTADAFLRFLS